MPSATARKEVQVTLMAIRSSELSLCDRDRVEDRAESDRDEPRIALPRAPQRQAPLFCRSSDSIFLAIERCIDNAAEACLVVDDEQHLLGSISLTQMRQAILDGSAIDHPMLDRHLCITATPSSGVADAAAGDRLIPIFDYQGRVFDVLIDRSMNPVQVARPSLSHRELRWLLDAFLSSWISGKGPHLRAFELEFASWLGVKHGIAVANGTVALHLALTSLGIGSGDEVIVPDLTFAATINAVLYCGATPVIVDIDPVTWTMSAEGVRAALSPRTRAVIPVHLYGRPAEIGPIAALAAAHGIFVVEDCAEAHGARYAGRLVGKFGDIACFSFHANKIVATGEGGMCLLDSDAVAARAAMLRDHGMPPDRIYWHEQVGFNYRLPNLQAAIGLAQLATADATTQRNRDLEAAYREALRGIAGVSFPPPLVAEYETVVWLVCVTVPAAKRAALIEAAKRADIELRPFFFPLSAMPLYAGFAQACRHSAELSRAGLNLPTSTAVDSEVIARLAEIFRRVLD